MEDRYIPLNQINSRSINYYICSLEDIVAAKLGTNRSKDITDIEKDDVFNSSDFDLLDRIIYDELRIDYFSKTRYEELLRSYERYKNKESWQNSNH